MARSIDEAVVERLYRQANASRWQVPADHFAAALEASAAKAFAGRTPPARDLERYLSALRLEELALACACAAGLDAAWDHFVLEYRPVLYRAADAMDPGGGARELADSLYADLFGMQVDPVTTASPLEPDRERRSLFRYFHGASSLATCCGRCCRSDCRSFTLPANGASSRRGACRAGGASTRSRSRSLSSAHPAHSASRAQLDSRDRLRPLYYVRRVDLRRPRRCGARASVRAPVVRRGDDSTRVDRQRASQRSIGRDRTLFATSRDAAHWTSTMLNDSAVRILRRALK